VTRAYSSVKRLVGRLFHGIRRLAGTFVQFAQRDQLDELKEQTRRLGSASVEASTYVQGELQAFDRRLSRIEEQLAELQRALEEREAASSR
jgi:hypothetical protein